MRIQGTLARSAGSLENVHNLVPARFSQLGIRGVLLDLENTLVPYNAGRLPREARSA